MVRRYCRLRHPNRLIISLLKLLFRYWQAETKKLESPFFDYKHADVKQALIEFMNVLSQHIEIRKSKFEALLNHAVKDAIYLVTAPDVYLAMDLEGRGIDNISEKAIAGTLKYLKIYRKEVRSLLSDKKGLPVQDVIADIGLELEKLYHPEVLDRELAHLGKALPIESDDLFISNDELVDDPENDLFKQGHEDLIESVDQSGRVKKQIKILYDSDVRRKVDPNDDPTGNIHYHSAKRSKGEIRRDNMLEPLSSEQIVKQGLKERDDHPDAGRKISSTHGQKTSNNSLMKAMSVNKQHVFQKKLFKDDSVAFQNSLFELEEYSSFDEAVEFLVQGYAKEFKWNMQSTEVKEFLKVLFRKFRD